jgi:hypothetical protein
MIRIFCLANCVAVSFVSISYSAVNVFDTFNYAPAGSDVAGNGGGGSFGFSDNWSGYTTFDLATGSLIAPVSFPLSTGNRVTADSFDDNRAIERTLTQPIGADNTTAYMSFLMQAEDTVGAGAYAGWFSFTLRSATRNITVGKDSFNDFYKIEGSPGPTVLSTVPVVADQIHLMVIRADFLPGADVFKLYIDPPTGELEPAIASATMNTFDIETITKIGLDGPGAFGFDELRIGATWNDVAPAPEPSTLILLIAGSAFAIATRHRKRSV